MKYVVLSVFAVATLLLTGCNTIAGAGRDIEEAGDAIRGRADARAAHVKDVLIPNFETF